MRHISKRSKATIGFSIVLCTIMAALQIAHPRPVHAASVPNTCLSPQASVDNTTLSDSDLVKYGLPPRDSMPLTTWKDFVKSAKHRSCTTTPSNFKSTPPKIGSIQTASSVHPQTSLLVSNNWTGNIADGSSSPFSEVDAVFYVPCISTYSVDGAAASWVGLGGYNGTNLVQAGTIENKDAFGYHYNAVVANIGYISPGAQNVFGVNCNDRMQAKVYNNNAVYVADANNGKYYGNYFGPSAGHNTAEWIVEDPKNALGLVTLADFQSETFYGMGDTETNTGNYTGPLWQTHDYAVDFGDSGNQQLMCIGGLDYNTTWGPPNDSNTIRIPTLNSPC